MAQSKEKAIKSKYNQKQILYCKYCNKECKSNNSLKQHECRCVANPSRKDYLTNGFNNKGREAWNLGLTKETSDSVLKQCKSRKDYYERNTNHISGGIRKGTAKKCKYGTYRGFYCDSGWELAFLVYNLEHDIVITRNTNYFEYVYRDKLHKYYPDFIINNVYYEIKGIYRESDQAKIDQFPETSKLVVIDSKHIHPYIKYCECKYGKDYASILYDRDYPCWLDKVSEVEKDYNFKIK